MDLANISKEKQPKRHLIFLRAAKAWSLAIAVFSWLSWGYIDLWIDFSNVDLSSPFIDGAPHFSFWIAGPWTFVIAFLSTVLHLILRDQTGDSMRIGHAQSYPISGRSISYPGVTFFSYD